MIFHFGRQIHDISYKIDILRTVSVFVPFDSDMLYDRNKFTAKCAMY
jgi:hypothetical protein